MYIVINVPYLITLYTVYCTVPIGFLTVSSISNFSIHICISTNFKFPLQYTEKESSTCIETWNTIKCFSWAKQHVCCKSHMWMILFVRIAHMSKPLNWSAITTKYHRNNWTFFKIHWIYLYLYKRKKFNI